MKTTAQSDRSARPERLQPAGTYARKGDRASRWSRGRRVRLVAVKAAVQVERRRGRGCSHRDRRFRGGETGTCPPPPRATRCRLVAGLDSTRDNRMSAHRAQYPDVVTCRASVAECLKRSRARARGPSRLTVHRACRLAAAQQGPLDPSATSSRDRRPRHAHRRSSQASATPACAQHSTHA